MSEELSRIAPAPAAESDYDSICAALMQTARGRWFLQEYAKRNRSADTQLLLAAIERIEAVVCAERSKQVQQGFRSDLLEMAKAITRTRAEVAEFRLDAGLQPDTRTDGAASLPRPPQSRDVFAAAERIRDVTWAMRGHGFDPNTCDQLEELADSILSASSLRDPTDRRASKLSEVLQYLEHRIETLLESSADGDTSLDCAPAPDPQAFGPRQVLGPDPRPEAEPAIAFAGTIAGAEGGDSAALEAVSDAAGAPAAAPAEPDDDTAAQSLPPPVEIALQEASLPPPPDPAVGLAIVLRGPVFPAGESHDIPPPASDLAAAEPGPPPGEAEPAPPIDDIEVDAVATPELAPQEAAALPLDLSVDPAMTLEEPASAANRHHDDPTPPPDLPSTGSELGPPAGDGDDNQTEPEISPQTHELEEQTAEITPSENNPADSQEPPPTFADHAGGDSLSSPAPDTAERAADPSPAIVSNPEAGIAESGDLAVRAEPPALAAEATVGSDAPPLPPVGVPPQGAVLPTVELIESIPVLPRSPEAQPAAALQEAARRAFLPQVHMRLDMPGLELAGRSGVPPAISVSPRTLSVLPEPAHSAVDHATDLDGGLPEPAGLGAAPMVPDQSPCPTRPPPAAAADVPDSPIEEARSAEPAESSAQPQLAVAPAELAPEEAAPAQAAPVEAAAAAAPQAPRGDPLAALKAMSDDELIALFS